VVTTYLDLIAYDIPRYHGSPQAWHAYRALQRRIALSVDGITTISADVARRLVEEVPRLEADRVLPLPLGLDHIRAEQAPNTPGDDLEELVKSLRGKRFVVVLGNDFQHKNRDFAIRVWEAALQAGQPCDLVLAGLHVKSSSSKVQEDDLTARHLDLRGRIHSVGHVSAQSRAWLLASATAVLYPTSAEGFGFVPYEAAALGTPTVFTDFGPLAEISGVRGLPSGWSIEQHAADLVALLSSDEASADRVAALQLAIGRHTWSGFAEQLVDFFVRVTQMPEVATSAVGADTAVADAAALSSILSSRTWRATEPLRRVGRRLRKS
jgi:glycosyltransferase involved in cell wall biosynthesis